MRCSSTSFIFLMLSSGLATFQTKLNSEWFAQVSKGNLSHSNLFFDFTTSLTFVSRMDNTTLFSPLCCDINMHTQMYQGEFGLEYVGIGKRKLDSIRPSVLNQDLKFYMANSVYVPSETTETNTEWTPLFLLENYRTEDASNVYEKHQKWVLEKTQGKITSPLKVEHFASGERIYSSVVYFKDFWVDKFEIEHTKKDKFTLRNGNVVSREFMNADESYKYRHVKNNICDFEMVAIPYEDRIHHWCFKRYMIYLIPKDSSVESTTLWKSFYFSCENDIANMLSDTGFEELSLSIPKIEALESEIDLCDIIGELFEEHKALYVSSKMKTFLQIDEEGTTAIALMNGLCTDGCSSPSKVVKANVPYIAFIYDVSIERILFILKDEGPKLN